MFAEPSFLTMVIGFLLLLGPLVLIHELGHYLVARWLGVQAEAFSIGFGKEISGWTDKRGTRWRLSWLPLGGYVQFAGDMNAASMPADVSGIEADNRSHLFQSRPLGQRALIVLAGPLTNFLVAILIFTGFNMVYGKPFLEPEILHVEENSAAAEAGIKVGDKITAIDGEAIDSFSEVPGYIVPYPGRTIRLSIERDGREYTISVNIADVHETDKFGNEARIGRIGVAAGQATTVRVGPVEAVTLSVHQTYAVVQMMVVGINQIVSGERSMRELGGPVAIAKYSGEQLSLGLWAFTGFTALISINLAFINLLPIPGLDGGHLFFYAIEAVRRKPLSLHSQEWALRTGIALVLTFMVVVTISDLAKLRIFGG